MTESVAKRKKLSDLTKEELMQLDKEDLVDKVIQYRTHNSQLKNIIIKTQAEDSKKEVRERKSPYDFTKSHHRNILLHIMYLGWDYNGFVVQEDTPKTIEHELFQVLTKTCLIESRAKSQYHRSGRTDKGVSALGQVISLNIRSKFPPEEQYKPEAISSELDYCGILNRLLPDEIKAVAWMPIPSDKPEFSARFDCKRRQYKYYFPRSKLDIAAMKDACARLVGSHDFRHLCKMDVGNGVVEYMRQIVKADILPVNGKDSDDRTAMYYLLIEGNAFLWHQIRCIMAVLLLIGEGREKPDVITELLDVKKNTRKPQYEMAINVPLNLNQCMYDLEENNSWVYNKHDLKRTIKLLQKTWTLQYAKTTICKESVDKLTEIYSRFWDDLDTDENRLSQHANCLRVTSKIYTPLLERPTCGYSLEEKIEMYNQKRTGAKKMKQEIQPSSADEKLP